MKLCVTAKVHVLERWNNNIKQLEDNMLKCDISFWNNWKDFSENKNCSYIELSGGHRHGKTYYNNKIYNEESLTSYSFLKMKSQM